ncbi:MAG: UvrD-helicase domain-containing protein [bacterium]|nr:UvrD-helicase domain-containing protein [bacterium]
MSHGLNPEQKSAVETLAGPLLVLAGAGSGKTRVVTFRIANLIRSGIKRERILAVTFTNKAAREMRERITAMLGTRKRPSRSRSADRQEQPDGPVIGTFHANCVQILRRHAKCLGYPERFAIYDRGDQESVARDVLRTLHVHSGMLKPGDLLSHISRWKNAGIGVDSALDHARSDAEHVAASAYRRYQQAIKLAGAMDFDDLLLMTEQLLREFPEVRKEEAGRFDHILVDEYQDTNQSQYEIIKSLAGVHRNLCVVGDDDQSIYGFRGAEVRHILNFKSDWPDAKVVRLEANYRSTAPILEMANRLIVFNKTRHDKVLKPARMGGRPPRILQFKNETEEAESISQEIRRLLDRGVREPKDVAILFRTNEQPRVFETQLRKAKVPYSLIGTQSFFDRREVKDLLCYLKIMDNPKDEVSLLRIINVPQRGIGAKSVETLLSQAVSEGCSVWEVMHRSPLVSSLPTAAQAGIASLKHLVERTRNELTDDSVSLASGIHRLIDGLDYLSNLTRMYPNPEESEARKASVEEFLNAVGEYEAGAKQPSLSGFLDDVALAGKEFGGGKEKQQGNSVSLMTFHSSKGLEFPIVYMVGMEEGVLPHRRSLAENFDDVEEERRLCYVGVTRAEDELTLSLPLSRMKWGKPRPTFVSRFLYELTGQADNPNRRRAMDGARKEIAYSKRAANRKPGEAKGGKRPAKSRRS